MLRYLIYLGVFVLSIGFIYIGEVDDAPGAILLGLIAIFVVCFMLFRDFKKKGKIY